jgi:hypothetical protein
MKILTSYINDFYLKIKKYNSYHIKKISEIEKPKEDFKKNYDQNHNFKNKIDKIN